MGEEWNEGVTPADCSCYLLVKEAAGLLQPRYKASQLEEPIDEPLWIKRLKIGHAFSSTDELDRDS